MMSGKKHGNHACFRLFPGSNGSLESSKLIVLSMLIGSFLLLAGCTQQPASGTPTDEALPVPTDVVEAPPPTAVEEGYPPLPAEVVESDAYPIATPAAAPLAQGYPPPGEIRDGVLFAINTPLRPGDTEVSGVGPAGLTVFILNVTLMGEPIGSGRIGDDGTFSIAVPALESNFQIGLFADLEAAGIDPDSVIAGPGARVVPLVGFFYDTALVPEQ